MTKPDGVSRRTVIVAGLVLALLLAGFASYYASSDPDGLTKVAADQGFDRAATDHDLDDSPLGGYEVDGVQDSRLSGGLAGVIGVGVTFLVVGGLVLLVRRTGPRPTRDTTSETSEHPQRQPAGGDR